jgi:hypothetical protein
MSSERRQRMTFDDFMTQVGWWLLAIVGIIVCVLVVIDGR